MYIEGRGIRNFADVQKNYQYEVTFMNAGKLIDGWTEDDVTLRARSFSLPSRGNEVIESNFGAMKQYFPGKPTFSTTTDITFEETESQGVSRFLHAWQQRLFNLYDGHANFSRKRGNAGGTILQDGVCDLIKITAYRVDNTPEDNKYFFMNAWLQNVAEVNIDYSQASDAVKFVATFQYDFWVYGENEPTFNSNGGNASNVGVNAGVKEK